MIVSKTGHPRKNIGFLLNDPGDRYQRIVMKGILDAAEALDVNILVFIGKAFRSPYPDDLQFNIVYDLASPDILEGLIIASSSMANFCGSNFLNDFCRRYGPLPIISIGLELEGWPAVISDNRTGIREGMAHLIQAHRCRRIAFVRGPKTNLEAEERFLAYREALAEHGIRFDDQYVVQGDFTYASGADAVKILWDERRLSVDAIVFANDEMMYAAFPKLQERGIHIPGDIAILGYDNIEETRFFIPSFTTIAQPIREQGRTAFELVLKMINGEQVPKLNTLSPKLIIRESCGCIPRHGDELTTAPHEVDADHPSNSIKHFNTMLLDFKNRIAVLEKQLPDKRLEFLNLINEALRWSWGYQSSPQIWHRELFESYRRVHHGLPEIGEIYQEAQVMVGDVFQRAQGVRTIDVSEQNWALLNFIQNTNTVFTYRNLFHMIDELFQWMGINNYWIAFYRDSPERGPDGEWTVPSNSLLQQARFGEDISHYRDDPEAFPTKLLIPKRYLPEAFGEKRNSYIVMSLSNRQTQFGFVVMERTPRTSMIGESVCGQISNVLSTIQLFNQHLELEEELKTTLLKLENLNRELKVLSVNDELTGLHNRRGFFQVAEEYDKQARAEGSSYLIFYIDLDGLKTINDNYGHPEGDNAIKAFAEILVQSFRGGDILARVGGDEFVVLAPDCLEHDVPSVVKRINRYIDEYNEKSQKLYKVAYSYGCFAYAPNMAESFDTVLAEADHRLYKQKYEKKSGMLHTGQIP